MDPTGWPTIRSVVYVYRGLLDYKMRLTIQESRTPWIVNRGFTLIETIIVLLLVAVLAGVGSFLLVVSLHAWDAGYTRANIREDVDYAMDEIIRDLKETASGSLTRYSSIAHTIQFGEREGDTYVLYLYNVDDSSFDSVYTESLYNLHKANITQGDNPASGEGVLILRDLVSPDAGSPATDLDISGTQVTLDIVIQRNDETVRTRTKVRPRNL